MVVHTVFFWLKKNLDQEQLEKFKQGVKSLTEIDSVEKGYWGGVAGTPARPVVDKSFSYGLTVVLKDLDHQLAYQQDPMHKKFVEECQDCWDKLIVYDVEE